MENNFDPTQYGATKVDGSSPAADSGFDPLKYGATRVDTSIQPMRPDQSAAALGHSNGMLSKILSTAGTMAGGVADEGINFVRSAIHAPGDIANAAMGKPVDQSSFTGFNGQPIKTLQAQGADAAANQFDQGATGSPGPSPLGATAGLVGQTVGGATDVIGAAPAAKALTKVPGLVEGMVPNVVKNYLANRAEKKAMQQSVDALYTSPEGKKFVNASSQVVTGQRKLTPPSMFHEQGLTPDQQTVNLATRLKDLKLGSDPVKNADTIATDFQKTEEQIQKELEGGDPSIVHNADKPGLFQSLGKVQTSAPEEFRIKDSAAMVNRVVGFASKVISGADDTLGGVRKARIAFDSQAKREFPTAFKPDGTIDTKTPAGYTIQATRDVINEHLYNTAPNGSEIQRLIGREADLFKAGQRVMEKASAGTGKKSLEQWAANNPKKAAALVGTAGIVGYGELKKVPVIGDVLPNLPN